ncbi:4-methylaminobutanoate oxidase (formaldehyde-forming) [Marinobacter litoralis]|uniref:4-methylaminobutanoate oxidase (Formaldehyde-forming) n=1 Tax=Marinobacter litoralis TaxID=187981 RepID=A0A3M2R8Y6_9GAMM|nr:FAD-dependent oxidoreductase [Marinobacter litoralis]RMJ01574.1 4-methylaminobutanoate oxidase (formaldehyde-forming) [Marinobacter litoralis]
MSIANHPDVVVIGGGILGCSIASYLSQQPGLTVTVIERGGLAEQTTSQAAGLLTRIRPSSGLTALATETFEAIDRLEQDAVTPLPIQRAGSLQVAASASGHCQLEILALRASEFGRHTEWLDNSEAEKLSPWLALEEGTRALFLPDDGYIDPYALCMAYARAARRNGVRFLLHHEVTELVGSGERVTGVRLSTDDTVQAGLVIDAAGPWSTALAHQQGINLAMAPIRSHYWISAPHPRIANGAPMTILPDSGAYARPEVGGLLFGLRDSRAVYAQPDALPDSLHGYRFDVDPTGDEALETGYPAFQRQCPVLEELTLAHYISSISSYTPDSAPLIGAMPGVGGFLAATGCSGAGVGLSGGIGRLVSDLVSGQTPFVSINDFRLDRFGPVDSFDATFIQRCAEARARKRSG